MRDSEIVFTISLRPEQFAMAKELRWIHAPAAAVLRLQQRRIWRQELIWNDRPKPCELAGATLGLIGLGSIGREVAARASALGMRVIGVREHAEREKPPRIDEVFRSDRLEPDAGAV